MTATECFFYALFYAYALMGTGYFLAMAIDKTRRL